MTAAVPGAVRGVRRFAPEMTALATAATWGVSFGLQKMALDEIEPIAFTVVRYAGMIALGWAVLLCRRVRGHRAGVARADLPRLAVTGVLGYSAYIVLSTVGLARTTAFSNALLVGTSPLFAALLLHVLGVEAVRRAQVLGMLVALAGTVVFLAEKLSAAVPAAGVGDALSLAGAALFAAYSVAQKPLLARQAVPVMMAWTCTLGALPVVLLGWPAVRAQDWSAVSPAAWATLAWTIVVPVYVAWSAWAWVIARLGVARTAPFMYCVPVFGAIVSRLLLGETFDLLKVAGAALILGGLALVRRREPDGAPAPEAAAPSGEDGPASARPPSAPGTAARGPLLAAAPDAPHVA
jgi:drug/metabolite transporter (DMT)-like permease